MYLGWNAVDFEFYKADCDWINIKNFVSFIKQLILQGVPYLLNNEKFTALQNCTFFCGFINVTNCNEERIMIGIMPYD